MAFSPPVASILIRLISLVHAVKKSETWLSWKNTSGVPYVTNEPESDQDDRQQCFPLGSSDTIERR